MTSAPTDYTDFFEFPTLEKCHGKPDYATLDRMKQQLMTNAQCVHSLNGGGAHGYLGLVLSVNEYNQIAPGTPFIMPPFPHQPDVAGLSQHETHRILNDHKERVRVYRETNDVQTTLRRQIVAALPARYLNELRDPLTNSITMQLRDMIAWLMRRYGIVDSNKVKKEEEKIRNLTWDVMEPPTTIFNKIENFCRLAVAGDLPRTENQKVNYGLDIVKKTGVFTEALREWYQGLPGNWDEFKTHFQEAHEELEKISPETINRTQFHQANAMIADLTNEVGDFRNEVLAAVANLGNVPEPVIVPASEEPPVLPPVPSVSPVTEAMNAATQTNAQLLRMIQQMQEQLSNLSTNPTPRTPRTPGSGLNKYCWSHGKCGHTSQQCRNKKAGHQDEATMENRMGGSDYRCPPATTNT